MTNVSSPSLACLIAVVYGLSPWSAAAQDAASEFKWEKGYLLQMGVSLATIPSTKDDRLQHLAAGSAISAFVTYKTNSFWKGCAAALAAGLAKEAYDSLNNSGHSDLRDVGYTLAGCSFTLRF